MSVQQIPMIPALITIMTRSAVCSVLSFDVCVFFVRFLFVDFRAEGSLFFAESTCAAFSFLFFVFRVWCVLALVEAVTFLSRMLPALFQL